GRQRALERGQTQLLLVRELRRLRARRRRRRRQLRELRLQVLERLLLGGDAAALAQVLRGDERDDDESQAAAEREGDLLLLDNGLLLQLAREQVDGAHG